MKSLSQGRASSYIWRSLIWGRELLLSGLRKRIGDGQETLVYGDAWIPRPNSFLPISPQVLDQETKVSDFIFPIGNWNVDLLKLCFHEEDVKAITSIPLSVNYHKDRWIWHYTINGIYSVKGGYRLEMSKKKECSGAIGSSLEPRIRSAFWRKVWSQEVPQKFLYFNWRAIKNYLPCRSNTLKRKIISDDFCPICNVNSESVIHALWSCPNAQNVWKKVLIREIFTGLHFSNYGDLFEIATMYLSKYEMRLFLYICWSLWQNKNKAVIEGRSCAQDVIFNRAHYLASEYGSLVKGEPKLIVEKTTKWSPPPVGKYKLNVDAASIPETSVGGIGVVVRNDKGEVMAALALPLATATSSKHAEIMVLHFGMKFARDAGFFSILIEFDSQGMVNDVKKDEEESWASNGHLIDDIKRSLQHFEDVTISSSPRDQVAHFLARHALNCNTMVTWIEEVPFWLESIVKDDMVVSS